MQTKSTSLNTTVQKLIKKYKLIEHIPGTGNLEFFFTTEEELKAYFEQHQNVEYTCSISCEIINE